MVPVPISFPNKYVPSSSKENLTSKSNLVQKEDLTLENTEHVDECFHSQKDVGTDKNVRQEESLISKQNSKTIKTRTADATSRQDDPPRPEELSDKDTDIQKIEESQTADATPKQDDPPRQEKLSYQQTGIQMEEDLQPEEKFEQELEDNCLYNDNSSYYSSESCNDSVSLFKNMKRTIQKGQIQEISRIEVPTHKVKADHVRKILAATHIKVTENLVKRKIEEIDARKRDALSFFRNYIRIRMLKKAKKIGIRIHPRERKYVRSFADISLAVKNNNSMSFYKKLWEVTTGQFDKSLYWSESIAAEYMKEENIRYARNEKIHGLRTNCMEQLARWARSDLVRRFQLLGKKYHGRYLSVSVYKGTKKRRKPGIFQENFIITTHKSKPIVSLQ